MPASQPFILSCDWGTSSFRLRLVRLQDQAVTGEVVSAEGIATVFNRWSLQKTVERQDFYREELRKHILSLSLQVQTSLENIPVVVSGMASSSIGMTELPYATLPFSLNGEKAVIQKLPAGKDFPHEIYLISGLRTQRDVMRGEETQVIGLISRFAEKGETAGFKEGSVFIFPGTHSKHIYLERGEVRDFETYMTGELFQVLSGHSILKEAVEKGQGDPPREADLEAFRRGVSHPEASNLLHTLFSVRVSQLFGDLDKRQNFYYLSGLLIGAELSNLTKRIPVVLCSGSAVFELYRLAVEELGLLNETLLVPPGDADGAAVSGHIFLYNRHKKKPAA